MRGDETRAGSLGQTEQRLIIGIGKPRVLWRGEFHAVGGLADGVQKKVDFIQRETEGGGVAFEDFLLFEQEVVAENQPPFAAAQPLQDLKSSSAIGKLRGEDHVRIENGTDHFHKTVAEPGGMRLG